MIGAVRKGFTRRLQRLLSSATGLNAVSDELGKSVAQIDSALNNLNVGIPVWVPIEKLNEQASLAFQKIQAKLSDVQALAAAVNQPKSGGFVVKGTSASKIPRPDGMSAESIYLRPVEPIFNTDALDTAEADWLRAAQALSVL